MTKTIINRPTPYNGDNIGNSFTVEEKTIPQDFFDTIKDNPKKILKWAKKERKLYDELIKIMEKQIIFERKLPKLSKKRHELKTKTGNRKYKPSDLFA